MRWYDTLKEEVCYIAELVKNFGSVRDGPIFNIGHAFQGGFPAHEIVNSTNSTPAPKKLTW